MAQREEEKEKKRKPAEWASHGKIPGLKPTGMYLRRFFLSQKLWIANNGSKLIAEKIRRNLYSLHAVTNKQLIDK